MTIAVSFPMKPKLVQVIRLFHAVAELGYPVAVDEEDLAVMRPIQSMFGREFVDRKRTHCIELQNVYINHQLPETRISRTARPIVFPSDIARHCRDL